MNTVYVSTLYKYKYLGTPTRYKTVVRADSIPELSALWYLGTLDALERVRAELHFSWAGHRLQKKYLCVIV